MEDVEMKDAEQMDVIHPLKNQFETAEEKERMNHSNEAMELYQQILNYQEKDMNSEIVIRMKELSIYKLGQLYTQYGREKELGHLLQSIRPFFATIAKAKTGKIVRTIIDMVAKVEALDTEHALQLQADLCLDSIEWCKKEKHTFLRQRVQARLASIYYQQSKFQQALDLINDLLKEIKKLDDKQLLVEIHLVECKLHHSLRNLPKAKAALTAARSISNAIYIVPKMQAQIDLMSGILHADESDYKTAYSYFFEAFEALANLGTEESDALRCLKYMLLAKIASGSSGDVLNILNGKHALKYGGIDMEALKAVAKAHDVHSLDLFKQATTQYSEQLEQDPLINQHLDQLYDQLLESNLLKLIQPYSCVEIVHVANLIHLPLIQVETKLSQMILDAKLHGILDQGKGQLLVYDNYSKDETYKSGLGVLGNISSIVDSLFRRAEKLNA